MPFISKDWRSPGDYWVKSGSGWERFKVLQFVGGSNESGSGQDEQQQHQHQLQQQQHQQQPHCKINLRQTREISGFNTLSEALQLLDFQNALRDQRKFQYICVIIRLLISNPLLGGNSQRILVKLLFQICDQVRIGWRYDLLRVILNDMRKSLDNCWGGNLGSAQLWNENKLQIDKIEDLMATYKNEAPRIPLQDFPEDIIRLIILKLSSDKDLRNFAEADDTLKSLVSENRIWRQLCIYHFSRENIINTAIKLQQQQANRINYNANYNYYYNMNGALNNYNSNHFNSSNHNNNNNNCSSNNANSNLINSIHGSSSNQNPSQNQNLENQQRLENQRLESQEEEEENKENDENSVTGSGGMGEVLDWENVYKYLKRNFNLKEEYAEVLNYCKPCNVLFWPSCGHPCIVGTSVFLDKDEAGKEQTNFLVDVKPCDFVSFFST